MSDVITNSLEVGTQLPLDSKIYFLTLANLTDLGTNNANAFKYYEDMVVHVLENHNDYIWRELTAPDETGGLINGNYTYPVGISTGGVDYGGRIFNFFLVNDSSAGTLQEVLDAGNTSTTEAVFNKAGEVLVINATPADTLTTETRRIVFVGSLQDAAIEHITNRAEGNNFGALRLGIRDGNSGAFTTKVEIRNEAVDLEGPVSLNQSGKNHLVIKNGSAILLLDLPTDNGAVGIKWPSVTGTLEVVNVIRDGIINTLTFPIGSYVYNTFVDETSLPTLTGMNFVFLRNYNDGTNSGNFLLVRSNIANNVNEHFVPLAQQALTNERIGMYGDIGTAPTITSVGAIFARNSSLVVADFIVFELESGNTGLIPAVAGGDNLRRYTIGITPVASASTGTDVARTASSSLSNAHSGQVIYKRSGNVVQVTFSVSRTADPADDISEVFFVLPANVRPTDDDVYVFVGTDFGPDGVGSAFNPGTARVRITPVTGNMILNEVTANSDTYFGTATYIIT